ncbi:MAG: 3-methyladenine DNA glycosylase [Sulfurospirillaceae bacterium]|nr:3-methyladenine DNA glycosylase [Sulfurospirillaceae bacterium]
MNSFDLLLALKTSGYLKTDRDMLWWPRSGTFWVIVGAVLTQQTKWEKVEQSMHNLQTAGLDSLALIAESSLDTLSMLIKPSGFYNTKAKNLKSLCSNILVTFGSFEEFCEDVSRDWLLEQKGIGPESADSILCYACCQEVMVVDAYTSRLMESFGYQFESYDTLQEWMIEGIVINQKHLASVYHKEISLNEVYARFHGKIVEFCKENSQGKKVKSESLGLM